MSKQINPEALSKWVGQIPDDILQNLETIAPMLNMMGYTSNSDQPNYASLTNKWGSHSLGKKICSRRQFILNLTDTWE